MKKIYAIVLSLVMCFCAFGVVGCEVESIVPPTNEEELEENVNAEYTINVSTLTDPNEYQTMVRWANAYMRANDKAQVAINNNMSSMSVITSWKNANTLPDIVWTAGDQHSFYSANNYFVDLNEFLVAEDENYFKDFYSSVMDSTHHSASDNGIWFMPRDYNQLVFYVNYSLLQANGIAAPTAEWTWQDLEEICKQWRAKVTSAKRPPIEVDISWNPFSTTMISNFEATVFAEGKNTANSPQMKACLEYLYSLLHDKKYFGSSAGTFSSGDSPFFINVRPSLSGILKSSAISDSNVNVLPFPSTSMIPGSDTPSSSDGYVGVGCSGYAITVGCPAEKKQKVWEFLKYCMSEEGYEEVGGTQTIVPARKSLVNKGSWTTIENGTGQLIDSAAFVSGKAHPVSVSFANTLAPKDHETAAIQLMNLFRELTFTTFEFDTAISNFTKAMSSAVS